MSRLIEESVRLAARPQGGADAGQPFELVTFGKGGRFTTLDVDRGSVLIEQDDGARPSTRLSAGSPRRQRSDLRTPRGRAGARQGVQRGCLVRSVRSTGLIREINWFDP